MLPVVRSQSILIGPILLLAGLVSCSSKDGEPGPDCSGSSRGALLGGTVDAESVALDAMQVAAVGALVSASGTLQCTGSLVAPNLVLTARHCAAEELRFRSGAFEAAVVRQFAHESHDALVLQLDVQGDAPATLVSFAGDLGPEWVGRDVTLVGFGKDEQGSTGTRRYLVEPVTEVTTDYLNVTGNEGTGACFGDSGGPLLSRTAGSVGQLLGILSKGATDCQGIDRYERIDSLREWIGEVVEGAASDPCGSVSEEGACSGSTATWCEDGALRAEHCSGKMLCGYALGVGYRCLDGELDPCNGFGALPSCENDDVVRCERGTLLRTSCECGLTCALDATGIASCE